MLKSTIETSQFLLYLLLALTAGAGDYYVDAENGDDADDGLAPYDAWQTITHAIEVLDVSDDGDPIVSLAPGIYGPRERFPLTISRRMSIIGSPDHETQVLCSLSRGGIHVLAGSAFLTRLTIGYEITKSNIVNKTVNVEWEASLLLSDCGLDVAGGLGGFGRLRAHSCRFSGESYSERATGYPYPLSGRDARFSDCLFDGFSSVGSSVFIRSCFTNVQSSYATDALFGWGDVKLKDCQLYSWELGSLAGLSWMYSGPRFKLENCYLSHICADRCQYGFLFCVERPPGYFTMRHCTVVSNSYDRFAWLRDGAFSSVNCIVYDNGGPIPDSDLLDGFDHCCLDFYSPGEGNISWPPRFCTGPHGEYYLSQTAAGQNEDSPCVDAGSDTAEALGMDRYTTRTDGAPDTGQVDIGYHYPAYPGAEIELEQDEFTPNETMYVYGSAWNHAPPTFVDVYVGLVRPDGAVWTFGEQGWGLGISPWFRNVELGTGFIQPLQRLLKLPLPTATPAIDTPGEYAFAIALPRAGELPAGGDIKLTRFTVLD